MALLPDLLHLVKDVNVDDGRVRVVEDRLALYRVLAGRLVPDGIGVSLEIDRAAGVFAALEYLRHSGSPIHTDLPVPDGSRCGLLAVYML